MIPRVVYDTNVVVSAVLKEKSIPALLVSLALGRQVLPCFSRVILDEYEAVLKRPKFDFNHATVDALLRDLRTVGLMTSPTRRVQAALHEPDNRFLECAQAAQARYLVTGNKRHFPFTSFKGTLIVNPAELARILTEQP
jgi:putative PIN family toxin of toxin-antitoxin system